MQPTHVSGTPKFFLRLDGLVLFAASIFVFGGTQQRWWVYPVLLFVPDVFMLGYIRSTRAGAVIYNFGHSYLLPSLTFLYGWYSHQQLPLAIGVIWLGHVGFDRFIGYGLKYESSFKHTHLGELQRR